ncbi:DUF2891 domain-containing protein [Salinirubrum litoreum]|uniref:DUF2891 domain-containing protein n=1 Tax=Salinirubrum litoreum TaxID=1126234 RepID=A0ABD5RCF4_9EURY|nr:DUF2891 domain-containing protein [Salinirubrum litoreum]
MSPFASTAASQLLAGDADWLTPAQVRELTHHPQTSVGTEYPHYVGAVESPDGPPRPTDQHPVFYGCFDWHSAVHSHWTLVRLLRLAESRLASADADEQTARSPTAIRDGIDARLSEEAVAAEVAYLDENPTFERPYGWGWLLRLCAELHLWDDPAADAWRATLRPLEDRVVDLVADDFLDQSRAFRVGTHGNSAFALTCVLDYARVVGDDGLESAVCDTARRFYADDTDAPVEYEPLGWDFVSPALTEADLFRRVLDSRAFADWFGDFLPDLSTDGTAAHEGFLDPVAVDDEGGGVELHFVGLNCTRAWCLAGIADTLGDLDGPTPGVPGTDRLRECAERHARQGVAAAFTEDYAGAHWLSSFVCYLLTRNAGGIAPET